MIKAAIIGLGVIGEVHCAAIAALENARLIAACDTDREKQQKVPPGTPFYTSYEELFRREKPDVAHICLPHYLHYPVAQKAAEAGFHIFTEKPLALNAAEGREYAGLEARYGVKICLCLQNRLNPTTEALYRLLRGGEYGAVTGIRGSVAWYRSKGYYEAGPWRGVMAQSGGGCMINQAIHTLDLMRYLSGSPVTRVKGSIGQILDYGLEVEDTASARIEFANGAAGFFTASVANFTDESVEISVRCEKAGFILRDQTLFIVKDGEETRLASDSGVYAGKKVYGNSHGKLIDQFYHALETGEGSWIHPGEGIPALRLIGAIRESSASGKAVSFDPAC